MQVQSLGREDALEEGVATPPVFLPGESQTEEAGGLQSMESQESDVTERLRMQAALRYICVHVFFIHLSVDT